MAQRSHVPEFGNWDAENVPYTTYFENARKEKGTAVKMNPNDPEENPDAFMYGTGGHKSDAIQDAVRAPPFRISSNKMLPIAKHHIEERPNREGRPTRHSPAQHRGTPDQQNSYNRKILNSESSSDKSTSDHSLIQPNHHRARSDLKKSRAEGGNSFSLSSPEPARLRSGNHRADNIPHRTASVPKFGAWDETDPKSGDGFTIIFNKVKEEKQIGAAKLPTVPPQPSTYSDDQRNHGSDSLKSKICCCLFPKGNQ